MAAERKVKGVTARARLVDWLGRYLIAIGGIGIIAAVLGIFVFILGEAYPLFRAPELEGKEPLQIPGDNDWLAVGVDPYREVAFVVGAWGVDFLNLETGELIRAERLEELGTARIVAAHSWKNGQRLAMGASDGRVLLARIDFQLDYEGEQRRIVPNFRQLGNVTLDPRGEAIAQVFHADDDEGRSAVAGATDSGRLLVAVRQQRQGLLGPGPLEQEIYELSDTFQGKPTALLMDTRIKQLLVGTDAGEVGVWRLGDADEKPVRRSAFTAARQGSPVTALTFILGDISVAVGDGSGQVSTWFEVQDGQERTYQKIHQLRPHASPVLRIAPSQRDKQFLSVDAQGIVALHHMTSEQTFFQMPGGIDKVADITFAPKADGFLVLGKDGHLRTENSITPPIHRTPESEQSHQSGRIIQHSVLKHFVLDNPHPDVTWGILFREIWYESYPQPEYVWQSTGATDEFESKISLVPLVFGTIKGTVYALLFALPLAVLAAIYTAEFASPGVRSLVKPTVEVMASLPSVILGFLAGLWLAPVLESRMVGTLLLFPLVPVVVLAAAWAWRQLPEHFVRRVAFKGEIYLLVGVALLAIWLAYAVGPALEKMAFGGHFLNWLTGGTDMHYDQRNCLVVGFAMGFAVIPLIFTICEDALASIPRHLRAGSLALGATRWQTAIRVVLPMAVPGIFSAAMMGFGRAIGETMIVLMVTGNTPIMDWNIFNGMRTISANIAVELPEAPHHGSLYRVLFLSGLLLFMTTFFINTLAELVRQRLREKFNRL